MLIQHLMCGGLPVVIKPFIWFDGCVQFSVVALHLASRVMDVRILLGCLLGSTVRP